MPLAEPRSLDFGMPRLSSGGNFYFYFLFSIDWIVLTPGSFKFEYMAVNQ